MTQERIAVIGVGYVGYHPRVILVGQRFNDGMSEYVAQKMVKMLACAGAQLRTARVAVLKPGDAVVDVKSALKPADITVAADFWSL